MTQEELLQLVEVVRQYQCELDDIEVKSAPNGMLKRLYETLLALAVLRLAVMVIQNLFKQLGIDCNN